MSDLDKAEEMDLAERAEQLAEKARRLSEQAQEIAPEPHEISKAERDRKANRDLDEALKGPLETLRQVARRE